jgi:AcrR family transcriptional regulator
MQSKNMNNYSYYLLAFAAQRTPLMSPPLSPRKAPRQARAQVTRDAILEAATHIIAAGGLAAFNTNAVAERAGVSIGSLYQYFPNKDALMVALIERAQGEQLARVQAAAAAMADVDLVTTVRMLVRAAQHHHRENSLLASAIDHEEARLPIAEMLDGFLAQGGEALRSLLMQKLGPDTTLDINRAVRTLPALARAVGDAWANLNPPQLDIAEEEAVRAVLGYLGSGPINYTIEV